jgi:hypothetical protein
MHACVARAPQHRTQPDIQDSDSVAVFAWPCDMTHGSSLDVQECVVSVLRKIKNHHACDHIPLALPHDSRDSRADGVDC